MAAIDYVIIACYFLATLVIGWWSTRRRTESSRGFFVAEHSLPFWMIGFTMVAASISAEQMLGEVGYGFGAGMVVSNWELGVLPALLLMVFVFLPLYLRSGVTTIPEYLEHRFGRTTRLLFAAYTIFSNACIALVMVLALGTVAGEHLLGVPPLWTALSIVAFTGLYTVYGGMSAVAWTETFQCILLLLGGLLLLAVGLSRIDGGWSGLMERMYATDRGHLVRPVSDPDVPWPGLLLLVFSTNVWYCCTNQFYVQSTLGARSERHGKLGILMTAFLGPVLTLCFAFPGYIAYELFTTGNAPGLPVGANGEPIADAVYPYLVHQLFGPGLRGLLVAAVIGAIMSSVAAITNATASVFTSDIYRRWLRPDASDRQLIRVGRITGLVTLLVALPLTVFARSYTYIFLYSQSAWAILAVPISLVFLLGALWRRTTAQAAVGAFILTAPLVAVPFLFDEKGNNMLTLPGIARPIHLFNFAFILWFVVAAFIVVVSLLTPRPSEQSMSFTWRPSLNRSPDERQQPWYATVTFWSIVAVLLFAGIYAIYW